MCKTVRISRILILRLAGFCCAALRLRFHVSWMLFPYMTSLNRTPSVPPCLPVE